MTSNIRISNMSVLKLLLVLLLCIKQEVDLAIALRKFVYQKDISEYCRRRVMPSVFLGRQVIDAYSQILHFSRLELPYSCFVSIRTESGSNIILVIQLMSDKSLIESCRDSKNQLLVYEIGETFGGYWGALPDNVMKAEDSTEHNIYTLKTTQSTTMSTTEESTTEETTTASTPAKAAKTPTPERTDYIRVEVPIVNVSAILVPGRLPADTIFDPEDRFDSMFGPTGPGISYQTKVLPLVQFSIEKEVTVQRSGAEQAEENEPMEPSEPSKSPRFEVDFNSDMFTPDSRLLFPQLGSASKETKYNFNANRRLNFKKQKQLLAEKEAAFNKQLSYYIHSPLHSAKPSNKLTRHYDFMDTPASKDNEPSTNSWEVIDDILKNLSKTGDDSKYGDRNLVELLQGLSKLNRSESASKVPNNFANKHSTSTPRTITTRYKTDSITWRQPPASYRTNYLEEVDDTVKVQGLPQGIVNDTWNSNNESVINTDGISGPLLPLALDVDGVILNATLQRQPLFNTKEEPINIKNQTTELPLKVNGTTISPEMVKPLTLVDHESWENMVHAASLMAVVLNQSVSTPSEDVKEQGINVTQTKPMKAKGRKKRYIHVIPIEYAKPHHLPVKIEVPSSTEHADKVADAQEFQRLIEMQDDEVHDRVALRYLRQYVGPALFNICDFDEAAARHVYLFNSSRLVLAITNFTLERMTVVMTPARTLLTSDARCTSAHLECQVSGARVCIDSLSACDGVPNCGSYDIYDEDRLTCGGSAGLQHNVCLAAITFLAVLLTILYTVHYWLKRCVPRVSDAFFIYTDAAENVLYLDTIMRSPYDTDDGKDYRDPTLQAYMECTDIRMKKNTIRDRFLRLFSCKSKKRRSHVEVIEEEYVDAHPDVGRLYSFDEVELEKMGPSFLTDAAVQTGSSLEIQVYEDTQKARRQIKTHSAHVLTHVERILHEEKKLSLDLELASTQPSDELSILKFFRKARSVSMQMTSVEAVNPPAYKINLPATHPPHTEEKEIQVLVYDHHDQQDHHDHHGHHDYHDHLAQHGHHEVQTSVIASGSHVAVVDKKPDQVRKKLRFDERKNVQSPSVEYDSPEDESVVNSERPRRSTGYGTKNVRIEELETENVSDVEEPSTSANREFKSYFWSSGKNKSKKPPAKKKTQVSLR